MSNLEIIMWIVGGILAFDTVVLILLWIGAYHRGNDGSRN